MRIIWELAVCWSIDIELFDVWNISYVIRNFIHINNQFIRMHVQVSLKQIQQIRHMQQQQQNNRDKHKFRLFFSLFNLFVSTFYIVSIVLIVFITGKY